MKNAPTASPDRLKPLSRHDKTQAVIKQTIAGLIHVHSRNATRLLEVGAESGWQTLLYRQQLNDPQRTVIYDWRDQRNEGAKGAGIGFHEVDLEKDRFPDADESYDVVVCNQVFEHLKNIFLPLSEIHRVLSRDGLLILSVPNLSALHNVLLVMLGKQPTTIRLAGSHVRSYAIWSMSRFLTFNGHFQIVDLKGVGLHPLTSASLPSFLRTYCHTPIWALRKQRSDLPNWKQMREATFTTTNY
jgi:2-polyprenyl-3-methyl-5-hydroxy-6-metoxy-1,4-benzoquinol methylase